MTVSLLKPSLSRRVGFLNKESQGASIRSAGRGFQRLLILLVVTGVAMIITSGTFKTASVSQLPVYNKLSELFEVHFPQCAMSKQMPSVTLADEDWMSWLHASEEIRYIEALKPPRYDYSCFNLKPRYNCAVPQAAAAASDYQMIWRKSNHDQICDLNQLVEFVGGPAGLYAQRRNKRPIQILLQGNSYLRQVWEALVCGFHHQITNLTLVLGGPGTSLAYWEARNDKLVTPQELGTFVPNQQHAQQECHGAHPMEKFYWNTGHADYAKRFPTGTGNVSLPSDNSYCTDNMAMVEFGNVQFFFIFCHFRYNNEALVEAYQRLGISQKKSSTQQDIPEYHVDTLVYLNSLGSKMHNLTAHKTLSLEGLLPLLVQTQNKSLGHYFGANNPWITNPPDHHPCMPGIPDDEANVLMLFLLWQEFLEQQEART